MVVVEELSGQACQQLLAVRIVDEVNRGVGQRQAASNDKIGGGEAQKGQDDQFSAPAGHQVFQHAGGAAAIGGAADHVPVNGECQQKRHQDDAGRGYGGPD